MNWNQLQYVRTIAEEKSITRAAQKLYLTQPSLSLSLKHLEEELGTPLFHRRTPTRPWRSPTPTTATVPARSREPRDRTPTSRSPPR